MRRQASPPDALARRMIVLPPAPPPWPVAPLPAPQHPDVRPVRCQEARLRWGTVKGGTAERLGCCRCRLRGSGGGPPARPCASLYAAPPLTLRFPGYCGAGRALLLAPRALLRPAGNGDWQARAYDPAVGHQKVDSMSLKQREGAGRCAGLKRRRDVPARGCALRRAVPEIAARAPNSAKMA